LSKSVDLINERYLSEKYQEELEALVLEKTKEVVDRFVKDKLTGLYSLGKLQQDLQTGQFRSMALVKIRNFKNLNDFFGYEVGDTLLIQTAELFKEFALSKTDVGNIELYRVSGAHFVILADFSSRQLLSIVYELVELFESSKFFVEDEPTMFEMDGGVIDDKTPMTLSNADNALRESEKEKNIYYLEDSFILHEKHKSRLKWIEAIKNAINEGRIIPYYQPIVDNQSSTISKYEALVRMISHDGELIPPGSFFEYL
jgi:diguanylate cyclase (GGDEF)-like protein